MTDHSTETQAQEANGKVPELDMCGIFVSVNEVEGQGKQVKIEPIGGFDLFAAPIVLELASKMARAHVGLGHG